MSADRKDAASVINEWIRRHQPCLFGRIAAQTGRIHYCVLLEDDLRQTDLEIRQQIQAQRLEWTKLAFAGQRSGFVIAVVSNRLTVAIPDQNFLALARRLASLYLLRDVPTDSIETDRIWLEKPGEPVSAWEWLVGVNFFAAQGDGRWWNDHRIPGGIALSMNSVGHMVKSGALSNAIATLNEAMGIQSGRHRRDKLDDLADGLELAMRTIAQASQAVSGPATFLVPEDPALAGTKPACPFTKEGKLRGQDHCEYAGWYHTDFTLPSEYFLPQVARPDHLPRRSLDFTYLFHRSVENPDHESMGAGRQIRGIDEDHVPAAPTSTKMTPEIVDFASCARLIQALGR